MRGYPILPDDIGSRLAQMETRLTRLEQPHNLNYAKQLAPVVWDPTIGAIFDAQSGVSTLVFYEGRIYGPLVMFHICAEPGPGSILNSTGAYQLDWRLMYEQSEPTLTSLDYQEIASGSISPTYTLDDFIFEPSNATLGYYIAPTIITLDTGIDGLDIDGTKGSLRLEAQLDPDDLLLFRVIDNGFIGPDYEHVVP